MLAAIQRCWRTLRNAPAGERFQNYHKCHRDPARPAWKRCLSFTIAIVVLALGLVALPAPGPGMVVLFFGFALLGRELLVVARALDAIEMALRRVLARLRRTWRHASTLDRVGWAMLAVTVALVLLAGPAWAAYRFLR